MQYAGKEGAPIDLLHDEAAGMSEDYDKDSSTDYGSESSSSETKDLDYHKMYDKRAKK